MSDESVTTLTDEEIDAALEAELDAASDEASDLEGAESLESEEGTSDELTERLKTLGVNDDLPEDLSPTARELLTKVTSKADERVRGFQSGFAKATSEYESKARAYDALTSHPDFQEWLDGFRARQSGEAPPPSKEDDEVDLSKLPEDPLERFNALTDRRVEKAVNAAVAKLEAKLTGVTSYVSNLAWKDFVGQHPDAKELAPQIQAYMGRGLSLEEAYKTARAGTIDESAIEKRVLQRIQKRVQEKKRAGGVTLTKNVSSGNKATEKISEVAQKEGRTAALLAAIESAEREHGMEAKHSYL